VRLGRVAGEYPQRGLHASCCLTTTHQSAFSKLLVAGPVWIVDRVLVLVTGGRPSSRRLSAGDLGVGQHEQGLHTHALPVLSRRTGPVTDRKSSTAVGAAEPDNGNGRQARRSSPWTPADDQREYPARPSHQTRDLQTSRCTVLSSGVCRRGERLSLATVGPGVVNGLASALRAQAVGAPAVPVLFMVSASADCCSRSVDRGDPRSRSGQIPTSRYWRVGMFASVGIPAP
jgi:hypothetical protein